ncbi:MAG TPA: tetratricopeptide repeat protein [Candidatus Marinimicrobia bacterium]|nr:tetratricopeptide repeat protein [Candidatus Neomarinimicrobiota bacterium]
MTALNKVLFKFFLLFFVSISIGADKGIDHYNNNEFEKARQYYESILIERNDNPAANFGLGSTAFQQQDYAAAMKGFETALGTDNDKLKSSAYYNMANILAQNQRLEESLAFFRKSLELNPSDLDAKINYELIKFQLQQQQNQDQNQNQDENNKDDEQSGDQKKQDQQKDKQQQEQNAQNDSSDEKNSEQQSNQNEDQQEDQTQQQQQDIAENEKQESQDKQNAAAILDALKKDEKINKKQQMSRAKKRKLEKDW